MPRTSSHRDPVPASARRRRPGYRPRSWSRQSPRPTVGLSTGDQKSPLRRGGCMHRIVGIALGAAVTYLLLVILLGSQYSDRYLWPVAIGAIVALVWPWFIGLVLARY